MKHDSQVEWLNCITDRWNRKRHLAVLTVAMAGLLIGIPLRSHCHQVSSQSTTAQAAGWIFTGDLNAPRTRHTATLLQTGKVLVAGGSSVTDSAELYDSDTGIWTVTGNLRVNRIGHTATLLPNGKVLVVGGSDFAGNSLDDSELFDPDTGTWSITTNLNTGRHSHTATLLQSGKVLVAGGQVSVTGNYGNTLDSAELYDPNTATWSITRSLHIARHSHTATVLANGKVLVAGGAGGRDSFVDYPLLKHAELYDPAQEKWSDTGFLNANHYLHTAVLLPSGEVLVACGGTTYDLADFPIQTNRAELYDPATGEWSYTRRFIKIERDSHTAVLMPNGQVLVAGGVAYVSPPLNSVELYDPETGTFSSTLNLTIGRFLHTATLLANGKVLVAGGNGGLNSAELYDPAAIFTPKIISVSVEGKKLPIFGENFEPGAVILLNGEEQRTKNDPQNPQTALIGKKAGKKIKPGDKLQVRNPNGLISAEFTFTGT